MTIGHFVWTDLSTYDMTHARADYAALFGWSFSGDTSYDFALNGAQQVAAVFPMPAYLAKINMPSFWMSYVRVEDVEATVAKARAHEDVVIEVEPEAFGDGKIALVRDPSGAGFTVYEGPDITAPPAKNRVVGRYHHVPDIKLISEFYADLLGWRFERVQTEPWPVYDIVHPDGTVVAQVEEVPEEVRGKFRYWMPCFEVASLAAAKASLEARGGGVTNELTEGRVIAADRQGAHFMLRQSLGGSTVTDVSIGKIYPWRAVLGVLCIWLAVVLEIQAFWGILFLIWTWPALRSGQTVLIDAIDRRKHPGLFWVIIGTWIVLSVWLIWADPALPFNHERLR